MTQEQMRQYEAVEPGSSTGARALISHQVEWSGRRSKVPLGQPPPLLCRVLVHHDQSGQAIHKPPREICL